jgi:cyclopropane fatty-acyl-phospholipid synthase-like methyltransferase
VDNQSREFNKAYKSSSNYFGDKPEQILVDHADQIDGSRPALDIGTGQGRNAFFLAHRGIDVDAIDSSEEAVSTTDALAKSMKLPVVVTRAEFGRFEPSVEGIAGPRFDSYGAICLFGLIQLLTPASIQILVKRVLDWSGSGTLLFLTAFTTGDPSFQVVSKKWKPIGDRSYMDPGGAVRTFLEPGQAPHLFAGFSELHHREGMGPEHRHGDGPLQRHAVVEAVLERRAG